MDPQSMPIQAPTAQKLNPDQIQWLLTHMSSDDQAEVGKIMRECTSEMTLTRGLPFAAFTVGSLYFARSRLPESLRFGPKRWPFYALVGLGSMTTANLLSVNKCTDRIHPKLNQLWQKYNQGPAASPNRYNQIREQNRARQFAAGSSPEPPLIDDQPAEPQRPSQPRFLYDQELPVISGTPSRSAQRDPFEEVQTYKPEVQPRKGGESQYGDVDFS